MVASNPRLQINVAEQLASQIVTTAHSSSPNRFGAINHAHSSAATGFFNSLLEAQRCCFVCLNDYIDKILIPRNPDYQAKASRTIHLPAINEIGSMIGQTALRWYAKRPKLFSAFQRFVYQENELKWSADSPNWEELAIYFARRIQTYDFWKDTEMWIPVRWWGDAITRYLETGDLKLLDRTNDAQKSEEEITARHKWEVYELWRQLALLPRTYEDVCREWFLPTSLALIASYPESFPTK